MQLNSAKLWVLFALILGWAGCRDVERDAALTHEERPVASHPAPGAGHGWKTADLERITDTVRSWVDAQEVVGAEFLILEDRKVVLHDVAGWKDVERKEPMERGTIFCVRSMTKPIIGTAVQMLIDEKKLALDDKASKFLPSFDNERSRDITVEQMLTHRSGFPLTLMDRGMKDYANHRAIVDQAGEIGPHEKPGKGFEYSDTNFETLTEIVSIVSGKTAEEFVRERILEPLGMRDTYCVLGKDAPDRKHVSSNYMGSIGHWEKFWDHDAEPFFPIFLGAAGAYSTCEDYARFVALWLDHGRIDGRRLLSDAAIERALRPIVPMLAPGSTAPYPTAFEKWRLDYGQAWMIWTDDKPLAKGLLPVFGHGGSDGTFAWVFPEQNVIALYFTQSRNGGTCARFEELVAGLVGIPTQAPVTAKAGGALPIEALTPLGGGYGSGEAQSYMFLRIEAGQLVADAPGSSSTALEWPDADGRWAFKGTAHAAIQFVRDEHGVVTGFDLVQGTKTYAFLRLQKTGLPSVDELEALRVKSRKGSARTLHMHGVVEANKKKGEVTVNAVGSQRFSTRTQLGAVDQTAIVDNDHVYSCVAKKPREELTGAFGDAIRFANPLERFGDWRHDGAEVEVVDKLETQDRPCWVVRVKPKNLPTIVRWVDVENGRVLSEQTWQMVKSLPPLASSIEFTDWRDAGGVDMPAHVERQSALSGKVTVDYDVMETNVEIAPEVFATESASHG